MFMKHEQDGVMNMTKTEMDAAINEAWGGSRSYKSLGLVTSSCYRAVFIAGMRAAARIADAEGLDDPTQTDGDEAYDLAISHAVNAVNVAADSLEAQMAKTEREELLAAIASGKGIIFDDHQLLALLDRCDKLEAALTELVALKDQKMLIETQIAAANDGGYCRSVAEIRLEQDYKRRKPLAWEAARAELGGDRP